MTFATFRRPLWLAAIATVCAAARATPPLQAADFATRVLAYNATNGMAGYTSAPENALGAPSPDALPDVPDNASVVSFGWGGSLTLGFNRPVRNDPRNPGGYDFIVFGNALYRGGDMENPFREPGYVEVGIDPSGRHAYGDGSQVVWYWLKGRPAPDTLAGFPVPPPTLDETVTGYADCTPTDGSGDPLLPDDPETPGISLGTAGGDAFNLAWAVDAEGQPVALEYVDFVRITCAVNTNTPPVGRSSTEVDAVAIVRPRVRGDADMDNTVSLADAVLALRAVHGTAMLDAEQAARADMNADGGPPQTDDVVAILRVAGGLEA